MKLIKKLIITIGFSILIGSLFSLNIGYANEKNQDVVNKKNIERNLDNQVVYIPDKNLKSELKRALGIYDREITKGDMKKLTKLYISIYADVKDLTGLEYATNLTYLHITDSPINNIKLLSNLTKLESVYINGTSLSDIQPLANLKNLKVLDLSDNKIKDIQAISNLTNLEELRLSHNLLDDSDLRYLKNLNKLKILYLNANNFKNIDMLINLINIEELWISENKVENISSISKMKNLAWLNLHSNNIQDISPLSNLSKLHTLYLDNNNISNIKPLENLINLKFLSLSYNNISDIYPITKLTKLGKLDMSNNKIAVFPKELKNLKGIYTMAQSFGDQKITNSPVSATENIYVKNPVKILGNLATPNYISDKGKVKGSSIVWSNIKSSKTVYFEVEEYIQVGTGSFRITVTVEQPIVVSKKTLTNDIYKYDAGKGKYLTYINGKGYSQYTYINKSGNYAFTPSSWMKAAGLTVTMPTSSNGYTMKVDNPYIKMVKEANITLEKARSGDLSSRQIKNELSRISKLANTDIKTSTKAAPKKTLTNDIYKYDASKGKYLTYINGKGYSQYTYLNKSGNYAFTPSSWMKAAGLNVTMPMSSNGYTMKIVNSHMRIYNDIVQELNTYVN